MHIRKSDSDRFWSYVVTGSGCWEWIGHSSVNGYGRIRLGSKKVLAHRFSWELHFGDIPCGMEVCHKCDNPSCVNPSHLFCGTHSDNMKDRSAKGRSNVRSGVDHCHSCLSELDVRRIVFMRDCAATTLMIAEKLGVDRVVVDGVLSGKRYKGVGRHYESS